MATTGTVNTSGISIGSDGKITFSGLSSGVDSKTIIDSIMTAKRAPAVLLETKITNNNTKISALQDLKTKTAAVTTALDALRGNATSTSNVFGQMQATGSTTPTDTAPSGFTPSALGDLVSATVASNAQEGTYTITIDAVAKAQQIRTDAQTVSSSTALGQSGTIDLNGQTITVSTSDSLLDIRDKINASGANVTATVVSASSTSNYLVLTSSSTGTANAMTFTETALSDALGLTDGVSSNVKTQLQGAADASLTVNGISGITRSTNQINDVISGVTLSLVKAEANTNINLKVEHDLNGIKTGIANFVTAYNDLRKWLDDQRTPSDRNGDGTVGSNEVGPLAYDSKVSQMLQQLGQLAATSVDGNTDGYKSLGQIGVTMTDTYQLQVDDATLDNRLLTNVNQMKSLFAVNVTTSDSRLTYVGRTADTVAGTYYVNIGGTDGSGNVTSANISATAGVGTGGADNGSATVSSGRLTATSTTNANGLVLNFNGGVSAAGVDGINVTVTRGIADTFYDFFNGMTKTTTGTLDTSVLDLQTDNKTSTDKIATIDDRLAVVRAQLENKYTAMEQALAKLQTLKDSITSYFNTKSSSGN